MGLIGRLAGTVRIAASLAAETFQCEPPPEGGKHRQPNPLQIWYHFSRWPEFTNLMEHPKPPPDHYGTRGCPGLIRRYDVFAA
jgi:hypothetical protein